MVNRYPGFEVRRLQSVRGLVVPVIVAKAALSVAEFALKAALSGS
jgi:hypothetical protein